MFKPIDDNPGVGATKNATETFAAYEPGDRSDMMWFLCQWSSGGNAVALAMVGVDAIYQVGETKTNYFRNAGGLDVFAAFNGIVGIASALSSGTIGVWDVVVPATILSWTASEIISFLGYGLAACAAIKAGIIFTVISFAIIFLSSSLSLPIFEWKTRPRGRSFQDSCILLQKSY